MNVIPATSAPTKMATEETGSPTDLGRNNPHGPSHREEDNHDQGQPRQTGKFLMHRIQPSRARDNMHPYLYRHSCEPGVGLPDDPVGFLAPNRRRGDPLVG